MKLKGNKSIKERIAKLKPEDREKLTQYVASIKEIKKEISKLLNEDQIEEGGDMMHLTLKTKD
jgi:hypothetical protein